MKKVYFLLLIILLGQVTQAQRKILLNQTTHDDRAVHFGFCLGINSMDFVIKQSNSYLNDSLVADVNQPGVGFQAQIISNYRLGNYFDLRFLPGVSMGDRTVNFYKRNSEGNLVLDLKADTLPVKKMESYYIELPLLLKYKAKRLNNFRPYLIGGGNLRIDLNKAVQGEKKNDDLYLSTKSLSYCLEAGAGIDFYLMYFKLSVELKASYGLNNIISRKTDGDNLKFQNSIESIHPSVWMLSFHFE